MNAQNYYAVRANPLPSEVNVEQEIELLASLASQAPPITSNQERLGGTSVIGLSRVPASALMDYFVAGDNLDQFLDDFPAISREEALAALEKIKESLDEGWLATRVDY